MDKILSNSPRFTKNKSHRPNFISFIDDFTALVNQDIAWLVHFDFMKAFVKSLSQHSHKQEGEMRIQLGELNSGLTAFPEIFISQTQSI